MENGKKSEQHNEVIFNLHPFSKVIYGLFLNYYNNVRPTVKTKHRADIINFLKPYPAVNQEQLDKKERQRQEELRQQQLRILRQQRKVLRQQQQ
jgi:hypothetical protein